MHVNVLPVLEDERDHEDRDRDQSQQPGPQARLPLAYLFFGEPASARHAPESKRRLRRRAAAPRAAAAAAAPVGRACRRGRSGRASPARGRRAPRAGNSSRRTLLCFSCSWLSSLYSARSPNDGDHRGGRGRSSSGVAPENTLFPRLLRERAQEFIRVFAGSVASADNASGKLCTGMTRSPFAYF